MNHWASTPVPQRKHLSREDFAGTYGADPADLKRIADFASKAGLTVLESSPARRTVVLSGTAAQMSAAFGVTLSMYKSPDQEYRGREGFLYIPSELTSVVEGVFGLDNRRMARRMARRTGATSAITPLNPLQVAKLYDFPTSPNASGQTIALLELGGGYNPSDISAYFTSDLGVGPGYSTPALIAIGMDGQTNGSDPTILDWIEVALDISVAGAVAQGANIAVYFAPFTEQGWVDIVTTAVQDVTAMPPGWAMPSAISISWGWAELEIAASPWSQAGIEALSATFQEAASLGVTVFVASGDNGSNCLIGDGKAHCNYPSSDPWVTCCGGTTIENVSGSSFTEITWNDNLVTGGGISDVFPLPAWQVGKGIPPSVNPGGRIGRGIPDIAGYANGYRIVLNGAAVQDVVGTSEVAPLYAGLIAMVNSANGFPAGYLNPTLYNSGRSAIVNIDDGGSNAVRPAPGYTAVKGWNGCTGLGRVNGNALLTAIQNRGTGFGDALDISATSWGPDRLDVFVKGTDNALWHQFSNGGGWSGWESAGGVLASAPAAVSWGPDRLDILAVGTDSGLWHQAWNGSAWVGWENLGGGLDSGPCVVSWGPNRLDVFVVGTDRALWHKYWNGDGTVWSEWESLGGPLSSQPCAVSWGPNRLDVFARGTERELWHQFWNGTAWSGWQNVGGVFWGEPSCVSWGPNRLDVFVRGPLNSVWHTYGNGDAAFAPWENLAGTIAGVPVPVSWGPNRIDVFATDQEQTVWHLYWNGAAWSEWEDLGGAPLYAPCSVSRGANLLDVFAKGADDALRHNFWTGSAWSGWQDLGGVIAAVAMAESA
jgi:kumamolisin